MSKFKDLDLIGYLRRNLSFGCIKSISVSTYVTGERNEITLFLMPFDKFFQNDLIFIRNSVLESKDLKHDFPFVKIQYLHLGEDFLSVVYIIG